MNPTIKTNRRFTQVILCSLLLVLTFNLQAQQNMAYVDTDAVIPKMESYKKAQLAVEDYGKQLQKMLEAKQKTMQDFYENFKGDLINKTPKEQQEAEAKLQQMQEELQKEAMEADQKLQEKEAELIKPVSEEFNKAIEKVAKENSHTYVMDKKMLLYSNGGIDITDKVKVTLGIQ